MTRPTHIPISVSRMVGSVYENAYGVGAAALKLSEARLNGSATAMQFAAEEIAELAHRAATLASVLERELAKHRRRNPLAGVR